MTALLTACLLLAQGPAAEVGAGDDPAALVGKVRLTRAVGAPLVSVVAEADSVRVVGELEGEVARLQSARVEVLGRRDGDKLYVEEYRILDVGGVKPMIVGVLVRTAAGFAIADGDGTPVPLSLTARARARLQDQDGAKLWVYGRKLLSGELKVLRYGVLRDAPKVKPPDAR